MTFLSGPETRPARYALGSLVRVANTARHWLITDILRNGHVVIERPDYPPQAVHEDTLLLVKRPRDWKTRHG